MNVLLFGSGGQLGLQLQRSLAELGHVTSLTARSHPLCGDLLDLDGLRRTVLQVRPDVVVNAAAYTGVDAAENDAAKAFAVNAGACEALAKASRDCDAWIVHYSTDYVYDGLGSRPWTEEDAPAPLNVYGRSKLAGDQAILGNNPRHLVLRTGWLFDSIGRNFASTILRAAAEQVELQVVDDQWGAPTRATWLADVTTQLVQAIWGTPGVAALAGVYHVAASGFTTRHQYAMLLVEHAIACGIPMRTSPTRVLPIATPADPTRAVRPRNTRLDTTKLQHTFGIVPPPWEDGVRTVVEALR